jgi:hypothetical protein
MGNATIAVVMQQISLMLRTTEPLFLTIGLNLFLYFASIRIALLGVETMLSGEGFQGATRQFFWLLMALATGFAMIGFYEAPIPGIGISFSNLVTDHTAYLTTLLDSSSLSSTFKHLDIVWRSFNVPSWYQTASAITYWVLLGLVFTAKGLSMGAVAGGLVANATVALVGPVLIPFYIVPQLEWIFWSWFRTFLATAFIPVVTMAYLKVMDQFVWAFAQGLPAGIPTYDYPLYGFQAIVVIIVFLTGIATVPLLAFALFSGGGGSASQGINIFGRR